MLRELRHGDDKNPATLTRIRDERSQPCNPGALVEPAQAGRGLAAAQKPTAEERYNRKRC